MTFTDYSVPTHTAHRGGEVGAAPLLGREHSPAVGGRAVQASRDADDRMSGQVGLVI